MKQKDWMEIVLWVDDMFGKGWTPEQATTWYSDSKVGLKAFASVDVWAAVYHLYEAGRDFPPNGSTLLARCVVERRRSAQADMYRGLPEARGTPEASDWIVKRFGESLSGMEVVERIHAQSKPCGNKACELHYPLVSADVSV